MNFKEELIKLRNILTGKKQEEQNTSKRTTVADTELTEEYIKMITYDRNFKEGDVSPAATAIANHFQSLIEPDLDNKIDKFIDWVINVKLKDEKSDGYKYREPKRIRNFIEKMAIWYELRYPSYEVNRLMHCSGQEFTKIDDVMFKNNLYVNELLGIDSDAKEMVWSDFYNKETFMKSLPWDEYHYLEKPTYMRLIYIDPLIESHFHLSSDGTITESEGLFAITNGKINDEDVVSKHIKDIPSMFEKENIKLPDNSEIIKAIDLYDQEEYFREELLNCVMYRIIERGNGRIGPRRAYLFAKEFDRNIDIPIMYAHDYADWDLRGFINTYIKDGGNPDLECYKNYFYKTNDYQRLNTITIRELLKKNLNRLTEEEKELHQRLVNTLNSQIDPDTLRKERVKQLRIERKLRKSKTKTKTKRNNINF